MRTLFAMILALGAVSTATACINDRELPSHEREFRSQYEENDYVPTTAEPESPSMTKYFLGGVGGAGVLLAVAGSIVLLRMRGTQQG